MTLRLDDRWIWDFWLIRDGPDHHVFYLQAPRSLEDPELRHWNVTIGHAVSTDLQDWEILPTALRPGIQGSWDDYTTWTGSIERSDGEWAMLYTGTTRAEKGLVQRIGLATSSDLIDWVKHPANPVIEADPDRYELLDLDIWHDQAWRDPSLVRDPSGLYHAFITARTRRGPTRERGVIAHATSPDLVDWAVGDPVVGPGDFGHLEIPQSIRLGDRWHLLYSIPADVTADHRPAIMATFQAVSDSLAGPYREPEDPVVMDFPGWFGAKLVETDDGPLCLAWRRDLPNGGFAGELGDPWPVEVSTDGSIQVTGSW